LTSSANYGKIYVEIDKSSSARQPLHLSGRTWDRKTETVHTLRKGSALVLAAMLLAGCAARTAYSPQAAEEKMVAHCVYMDTLAENSDMGAIQIHPKLTYDGQERILKRAEALQATHLVWMADFPFGSAAMAYRCLD
jgi:hypothetical protein